MCSLVAATAGPAGAAGVGYGKSIWAGWKPRDISRQDFLELRSVSLDPAFNAKDVNMTVTYLDKGTGSRSIGFLGNTDATPVQNTDSRQWKTKTVTFPGASELSLKDESRDDAVFHLIEVERAN